MPYSQELGFDFSLKFLWGLSLSLSHLFFFFFPTVLERALESLEYFKAFSFTNSHQ